MGFEQEVPDIPFGLFVGEVHVLYRDEMTGGRFPPRLMKVFFGSHFGFQFEPQ